MLFLSILKSADADTLLALDESVWSYDEIKKYEAAQRNFLSQAVRNWVDSPKDQKFDSDVRLWIYLNTRHLWDLNSTASKSDVEKLLNTLFSPSDLSKATPFNNFYLRFYDYSPTFPFRNLTTAQGYESLCKVCHPFYIH